MSQGSALEHAMLALVNAERAKHGLKPLAMERRLNDAADDHSQWMLDRDVVSHTGEGGSTATERMRAADFDFQGAWSSGESIAMQSLRGPDGLADEMRTLHRDLMDTPSHRANILRPEFEVAGIGIEVGEYQGRQVLVITQTFANTDAGLRIEGHHGRDVLRSGEAADRLYGRGGDDVLFGKAGADRIKGASGDDKLVGGAGDDRLSGGAGKDKLVGGAGDDRLSGGRGNDRLKGGAGDDVLDGGAGNDRLKGGAGSDVFVFSAGRDVVLDFTPGEDVLDLSDAAGIETFEDVQDAARERGNKVVLDLDEGRLVLKGVEFADLGADDFLL